MPGIVFQIEAPQKTSRFEFFELGFRPFFLLASFYAVLSVGLWAAVYIWSAPIAPSGLAVTYWHAHELVFGYGFAVVAGFLLTAIPNWTGLQTIRNGKLALLVSLWIGGRILFLLPAPWLLTLTVEMLFGLGLLLASSQPLYRSCQLQNLFIFSSKIALMTLANACFYLGMAGYFSDGLRWGLYTGIYLLIALVFTLGRRVIPFFIERGVGHPVQLRNSKLVDLISLFGMLGVWLTELFTPVSLWSIAFALLTASAQVIRLYWWHVRGIWRKPMLWVLWAGLAWITVGLILKAVSEWQGMYPFAAWHAMTYGGIGMVTLGMMARASLGHSGRDVLQPPRLLGLLFLAFATGAAIRSLLPLLFPSMHMLAVEISMAIWIFVFALFFLRFFTIWVGPSVKS
jgi:uncharacterized protein involved in response to NO